MFIRDFSAHHPSICLPACLPEGTHTLFWSDCSRTLSAMFPSNVPVRSENSRELSASRLVIRAEKLQIWQRDPFKTKTKAFLRRDALLRIRRQMSSRKWWRCWIWRRVFWGGGGCFCAKFTAESYQKQERNTEHNLRAQETRVTQEMCG